MLSHVSLIREVYLLRMRYGDMTAVATLKFLFLSSHEKTEWEIYIPVYISIYILV
jgi:hypothetical protein